MTHLFNSRRRCVPSLGSQARLGQEHTGDLQKECCTNLEEEIQELRSKAKTLESEARGRLDKALAELDAKQKAARAKLAELGRSSANAWQHLKQGTVAAWEELEQAVKAAVKEF